mmetsp:Transcript_10215/g.46847  ORF Transcript_10215/g.46847 Transcript_10215/m.46847 type:complete len:236 (+) Transcript_10215:3426-4133(+)
MTAGSSPSRKKNSSSTESPRSRPSSPAPAPPSPTKTEGMPFAPVAAHPVGSIPHTLRPLFAARAVSMSRVTRCFGNAHTRPLALESNAMDPAGGALEYSVVLGFRSMSSQEVPCVVMTSTAVSAPPSAPSASLATSAASNRSLVTRTGCPVAVAMAANSGSLPSESMPTTISRSGYWCTIKSMIVLCACALVGNAYAGLQYVLSRSSRSSGALHSCVGIVLGSSAQSSRLKSPVW